MSLPFSSQITPTLELSFSFQYGQLCLGNKFTHPPITGPLDSISEYSLNYPKWLDCTDYSENQTIRRQLNKRNKAHLGFSDEPIKVANKEVSGKASLTKNSISKPGPTLNAKRPVTRSRTTKILKTYIGYSTRWDFNFRIKHLKIFTFSF